MFNLDRDWQPWEDLFRVVLPTALAGSIIGAGIQAGSEQRIGIGLAFAGTAAWNLQRIVLRRWRDRRRG